MFLNDIFESDNDMFADNRRQSYGATLAALTEILNELVDEYSADPTEFADGGRCLDDVIAMRDAFAANDLVRGLSFVDNVDLSTLEDIDIKLGYKGIDLNKLLDRYGLNESDDDMFGSSRAMVWDFKDAVLPFINKTITSWRERAKHKAEENAIEYARKIYADADALEQIYNLMQQDFEQGVCELYRVAKTQAKDDWANEIVSWLGQHIKVDTSALARSAGHDPIVFESEDDMFAQRGKANVSKISTDQLRNMYSLAMSDSRQEYASAHKLQMARISTELKRRGVPVPVRENDDMFAGSNRASDQIKQDRHPLKDYITYERFEMLMDEFDDLKSHTTQHYEQDAYLYTLKQTDGLPEEFFDVIEYYMYAPTKTNAENDTKLHNDLIIAFRRTRTEFKPSTMVGFLARSMSRACLAAIREKDEVNLDESEEDMFAPASKSTIATAAKRNVVGKVAAKGRASRKTDTELQEIVSIAEQVFGRKYSSGTIGGGKVYRISLMTHGLGGMYHYNSMASVSKNDKIILGEQKKKFFNILTSRGLDTSRVDVKYHMGAMLYTSVRIKMQLPDAVVEDKYSMLINEMFENADDEMFAPQKGGKYWGNVPPEFNRLWGDLVPDSGSASTLEGELLRAANRLYYDYFNNGFGNNTSGAENFLRNFGGGSTRLMKALNTVHPYTRGIMPERSDEHRIELALDAIFDTILYQVLGQQGNYHPSPGNMFDYSEPDDPNPEDEEEDDWGYEEDDDEEY